MNEINIIKSNAPVSLLDGRKEISSDHVVEYSRICFIHGNVPVVSFISHAFLITGIFNPVGMVGQKPGNDMMRCAGASVCIPIKGMVIKMVDPLRLPGGT